MLQSDLSISIKMLGEVAHSMKLSKHFLWFASLILIVLLLSGSLFISKSNSPEADKGLLDLSRWNFERDGNVKLDGQWEFYWNKLLKYKNIQKEKPNTYVKVPSTWNEYSLNGKNLSGEGYATYKLHIKTELPVGTMLGFRIYTFSSAYNLYINEKLIASNGKVATAKATEVGEYRPQVVIFSVPANEFDIIIQVSNFHYARGGFWYTMYMGSPEKIIGLHNKMIEKEMFLVGVLTIVSLFFVAIFILRRELKYSLYFACLCMNLALTVDMLDQLILLSFFPKLSLKFVIFIWYSSSIWIFFFLMLFMHELFKSKFSEVVVKTYFGIAAILQIVFIVTDTAFYSKWIAQISDTINIICVICTIVIVAIGIKKGQKDGWLNIAGIIIALLAYIHDDLYWMNAINSNYGEIIYMGLFIFIFLQMIIQAKRIKMFYDHEMAAELSFLQAQIKPHFLYNALNTFISISRYDAEKARALLLDFSNYLRRSFDFKDTSQFVILKKEVELAKAYAEIEKARFEERLDVNFNIPENLEIKVPMLILQPIIENAVNHGVLLKVEGGQVNVLIKKEGRILLFSVSDNGVGMDKEKMDGLFKYKSRSGVIFIISPSTLTVLLSVSSSNPHIMILEPISAIFPSFV